METEDQDDFFNEIFPEMKSPSEDLLESEKQSDQVPLSLEKSMGKDLESLEEVENKEEKYDSDAQEQAIRELAELFDSGDEDTKEEEAPQSQKESTKELMIIEEKESLKIEKSQLTNVLSQEAISAKEKCSLKNRKKTKKSPTKEFKMDEAPKSSLKMAEELPEYIKYLFEISASNKFKIINQNLTKTELKHRYQDIIYEFPSAKDIFCLVCLDEEFSIEDDIIICDLCNAAFHQSCYGSNLLDISPEDNSEWLCQRCSYLYKNDLPSSSVYCTFCPEMKGAIKQINENSTDEWGHIVCVNWIPEIYYNKEAEKENVEISEYKSKNHCGRKDLICTFCKIKYGDPLQCDKEKCYAAFHVICAQQHGLICNWKEMNEMQRDQDDEYYLPIYCKRHIKAWNKEIFEFSNQVEKKNNERKKQISFFLDPSLYSNQQKIQNGYEKSKKKKSPTKLPPKSQKTKKVPEAAEKELQKEENHLEKIKKLKKRRIEILENSEEKTKEFEQENPTIQEISCCSLKLLSSGKKNQEIKDEDKGKQSISSIDAKETSAGENSNLVGDFPEKTLSNSNSQEKKSEPIPKKQKEKEKKSKKEIKQIEKMKKNDKNEKIDKQDKSEKKHGAKELYKFRPIMAKLMKFDGWATEKEIKKVILDYMKIKSIYNKEREEYDISENVELQDILGLDKIPKNKIFSEFMHFLLKKNSESDTKEQIKSSSSIYEDEVTKIKQRKSEIQSLETNDSLSEDYKISDIKIRKKLTHQKLADPGTRILDQINRNSLLPKVGNNSLVNSRLVQNIPQPIQKFQIQKTIETNRDVGKDFFNWQPTNIKNKLQQSLESEKPKKIPVVDLLDESEPNEDVIFKKRKLSIPTKENYPPIKSVERVEKQILQISSKTRAEKIEDIISIANKSDGIQFRRSMNWLVKTESSLAISSINSRQTIERLWPKGALKLF